ncbi:MAG: putative oxidoreductase [Alteromonadaceae bacterium]|jgi:putative oxidoreductase
MSTRYFKSNQLKENPLKSLFIKLHSWLNYTKKVDFLAPLLLRLYLVPIFWMAGTNKVAGFDNIVEWFGNSEWGLGLPFPLMLAFLATAAEVLGALALLLGVAVRWFSIPLMITMVVAASSVHWDNGWQAITDPSAPFASERVIEGSNKLAIAKEVLQENANYEYLTSSGSIVMLNNGIEFSTTYFIMLLALLFMGAGRYVSIDYWVEKKLYQDKRKIFHQKD